MKSKNPKHEARNSKRFRIFNILKLKILNLFRISDPSTLRASGPKGFGFRISKNAAGFTLMELLAVMGIAGILLGFVTFNLIKSQRTTSVNSSVDTLGTDLKSQQTKAMNGVGSSSGSSYGIHFATTKYTLFKGNSYNPADTTNLDIDLNGNSVSSTFGGGNIVFQQLSGEVLNFVNGSNTITITSTSGTESKVITVNKYGVVTSIN